MNWISTFFDAITGGHGASILYVFGIGLTVIGGILIKHVEEWPQLIGAVCLCLSGVFILYFKIRKDIKEFREMN
ncbi:hypothetical protein [Brumimicrobium sp.]|uniref:hypothetical protein n=1 Tax=Brumimicrobium sp. TaxID=2029867 RepID=UPI002610751B|nr:hypothetical protein [uncultured Brumimicrobium sp.]